MSEKHTFELSRRKALAGLGAIGVASAGAGFGTSAYFSDEETFEDNMLTAGELDLIVNYASSVDQGNADPEGTNVTSGTINGDPETYTYSVADVKPGDSGVVEFCIKSDDNPAYVWMCGDLTENAQNGYTEPEEVTLEEMDISTDDADGTGQLAQSMQATLSYNTSGFADDDDEPAETGDVGANQVVIAESTLDNVLGALRQGIPLDGGSEPQAGTLVAGDQNCFEGSSSVSGDDDGDDSGGFASPCIRLEWVVPDQVGNEIQTDSVGFDLQFSAQQCRHTDGTTNLCDGEDGGGGGDDGGDTPGAEENENDAKAISFVAFCGISDPNEITDIGVDVENGDGEPVALSWGSSEAVGKVVLKSGGGALAMENFEGGTSGTAAVGEGEERDSDQFPNDPCPDSDEFVKFVYEGYDDTNDEHLWEED